ncbi:MAG TPA: hypothetical protein VFW07_03990 [Parafilimonas sp.]|nr:hypothetical protein [Parafilimonas sp.]
MIKLIIAYDNNHTSAMNFFFLLHMQKIPDRLAFSKWFRISLLNLLIVACLGVILRYKIAFSLPFIDQKFFLNAHSHFAFAGWISQALITFITAKINKYSQNFSSKKYRYLLIANLITAYGMLLSFPFEGYGLISIIFSTLSIFSSYAFTIVVWRDLNRLPFKAVSHKWFKAALIFNVISSFGAFGLAYMMANHIAHPNWYLASVYFFLHFQYNGWFFFACMGLLTSELGTTLISEKLQHTVFGLFAFACIPAYFLSALWLPIPVWVYVLVVIAAFVQLIGWIILLNKIIRHRTKIFSGMNSGVKYLLCLAAIALSIKLLLQLGSTIPALSTWAFGIRPIVIGYLHLILLGVITLFLIAYAIKEQYISFNKKTIYSLAIFIGGIILTELLLMIQGLGAIKYKAVPYVNELLFTAACIMLIGIGILYVSNRRTM